jgi:hypothetical protein
MRHKRDRLRIFHLAQTNHPGSDTVREQYSASPVDEVELQLVSKKIVWGALAIGLRASGGGA